MEEDFYIKEVLVVMPDGSVLTEMTEDDDIRHDYLVGQVIQKYLEPEYKIETDPHSFLQNAIYATMKYKAFVLMPDVSDFVIIVPEEKTKEQAAYYLEAFSDNDGLRMAIRECLSTGKVRDIPEVKFIEELVSIRDSVREVK